MVVLVDRGLDAALRGHPQGQGGTTDADRLRSGHNITLQGTCQLKLLTSLGYQTAKSCQQGAVYKKPLAKGAHFAILYLLVEHFLYYRLQKI